MVLARYKPTPPVGRKFWKGKDYWRKALADLRQSYGGICAYSAMEVARVTGSPTVEHFLPKSHHPALAYDWTNYRLVCQRLNGRKGDHQDVLDPFSLPADVFDLNPANGEILVHRNCPPQLRPKAESTIKRLHLDDPIERETRLVHAQKMVSRDWSQREAEAQSPFVFRCLKQQRLL